MTSDHPITPPPELVQRLAASSRTWMEAVTDAYRAGADQELDACCEWMAARYGGDSHAMKLLRAARRPKPPSLKELAIKELVVVYSDEKMDGHAYNTIRRALEQLPN